MTHSVSPREAVETYTTQAIEGASPGHLVLALYDHVLRCIRAREAAKAKKGIVELMGSLDLDYLDIAGPLYRVYEYSLDIVRSEKWDEAESIFVELRDAWEQVIVNGEAPSVANT